MYFKINYKCVYVYHCVTILEGSVSGENQGGCAKFGNAMIPIRWLGREVTTFCT
jgi:hypothetical protein